MQYVPLLLALTGVFTILATSELLWRLKLMRGESARKFVHIGVGTFVAFWPYFLTWREIEFMSLAFLAVIIISMQQHIFHAVHNVNRRTWGELFFPIGIGVTAFLTPEPIVFTAAILHLSLADGLAAVVGSKYGVIHKYSIRNYTKTLVGTLMFFMLSLTIVTGTVLLSGTVLSWPLVPLLIWLPLAATAIENLAVAGTDNLFVPLLVTVVLQQALFG